MAKITVNLNQKMFTIRGEPIKQTKPDLNARRRVLIEIASYPIGTPQKLAEDFAKWQKTLRENVESDSTLRDNLLMILGAKFILKDKNKEVFWTSDLGIEIADKKNKEIVFEEGDEKYEFLKRIISDNVIKRVDVSGQEKTMDLFFPYELGQILKLLTGVNKPIPEKEKTKGK